MRRASPTMMERVTAIRKEYLRIKGPSRQRGGLLYAFKTQVKLVKIFLWDRNAQKFKKMLFLISLFYFVCAFVADSFFENLYYGRGFYESKIFIF